MVPRGIAVYSGLMAVFATLFFTVDAGRMVFWGGLGLATAVAVVLGVVRNRPRRSRPWIVITAALLSFTAGDLTYMYISEVHGVADPFPSVGDVFYLAFYPLLVVGLVWLLRSGAASRDRASLLDALTVTAGLGLLSWIFMIRPLVETVELTWVEKSIAVAYPLFDVLLVTVLIRMATAFHRSPSVIMLTTGLAFLLVGDVLYSILQINSAYQLGGVVDLLYVILWTMVGAAALHPSMVKLTEPRVLPSAQVGRGRVALLGLASLIPPAVLLVQAASGRVSDGIVIGVLSAVLFGLVVARLAGVVAVQRRSVAREQGLRRAGAALLTATSVDEVTDMTRTAVAELLPRDTPHRVVVEMSGSAAEIVPPIEMVYRATLDVAGLAPHPVVLRSPLSGRRISGYLYVAAEETVLVSLQDAVQVLASQAALALEGLAANAEVVRRESQVYFRTLVLNAADVILIVDDDDRVRYASPSAEGMFGGREPVGVALADLVEPQHETVARTLLADLRAGRPVPELTDWAVRRDPDPMQVEVSCRDLRHEPSVAGVVVTLRDVTERRRLEYELLQRAYYDALTGLPNRALFTDRIERTGVGPAAPLAVLLIGLDDFKVVNDTLGNEVGDDLLVAAGERLAIAARVGDCVARLGGDEFALLLEDAPDDAAEALAQRVVDAFAEPFLLPAGPVTCHASVGVVAATDAADGTQLLNRAEIALATAKTTGKSRWCRYEAALHTRILERLQLRAALDQAIADGEFTLNYQPLLDLGSGEILGFEALVRWQHPTRGLVPPLEFIDIAEESGLIVQLGAWVLRTAIDSALEWQAVRPDAPPYVSVNVSPRQFLSPGFVETVCAELARTGLPPHRLVLEITESLVLSERDPERVWQDLDALRRLGVRVAIDDFGTGYSSLSYLHRVPADLVKLDKSFVDTISTSVEQFELVKGIVGLVHTLKLAVVAEGVETTEDRDLLIEAGCEFGQGYLFARPASEDDALRLLRQPASAATV